MSIFQVFAVGLASLIAFVSYVGIRRTGTLLLSLYRRTRLLWLQIKGTTATKEVEKAVISGTAWDNYCDTLKAAGSTLLAPGAPTDAFTQAEGYRYLTRLVRASLSSFLEGKDFNRPKFMAIANGWLPDPVKLGSDNPDNLYEAAIVTSRCAYLVTVKKNSVHYHTFGTQAGQYGQAGGLNTVMSKDMSEFVVDFKDKNVVKILMAPIYFPYEGIPDKKNFMLLDKDIFDGIIISRQTFNRRDKEIAALVTIEKIAEFDYDVESKLLSAPRFVKAEDLGDDLDINDLFSKEKDMLTCDQLVGALETSGMLVAGASMMFATWAKGFQSHANQLPLFNVEKSNRVGGDHSIRYYHSYWRLADDEALVVTATPPEVFTWNFQVNNYWMESLDYRYFRIHVNQATAKYKTDGSIVIILTLQNPKLAFSEDSKQKSEYANWLSTTGHNCGTMCFRWVKPKSFENLPQPQTKVCKFEDIPKYI